MDDLLAAAGLRRADIDRLGEALRQRDPTNDEIDLFNSYRDAFASALAEMVGLLHELGVDRVTERQKTLWSTVAKLKRSTARLTQVQDVAGCRIVVAGLREQDSLAKRIHAARPEWRIFDRRERPSHGYRAVHIIGAIGRLPVELQVRTELQHQWAELSESWDRAHPGVKYGLGSPHVLAILEDASDNVALVESIEARLPSGLKDEAFEVRRALLREILDEAAPLLDNQ